MSAKIRDLQNKVQLLLVEEGLGEAIAELKQALPEGTPAARALLMLEAALREVNLKSVKGSLSQSELDVRYASLRERLLELLDSLEEKDFSAEAGKAPEEDKQGHLLYQIPDEMEVLEETRCRVRIAYEEGTLLEQIELTKGTELREIRISEVMEVQLIDPAEEPAFSIRTFNRAEQFLETAAFTEWIFYVKPLREGRFPLLLRVSVIEKVGDKERVRDIVLEEQVDIVADLDEAADVEAFKSAGMVVGEHAPAPPKKSSARQTFSRLATVLSAVLMLSVVAISYFSRMGGSSSENAIFERVEEDDKILDPNRPHPIFPDSIGVFAPDTL